MPKESNASVCLIKCGQRRLSDLQRGRGPLSRGCSDREVGITGAKNTHMQAGGLRPRNVRAFWQGIAILCPLSGGVVGRFRALCAWF